MPLDPTIYATFVSVITQDSVGRAIANLNILSQNDVRDVHVLFQSAGGIVGDGLALFTYFDACPMNIHLYNGGSIDSASVVSFLGARHRYTSAHATFMIHNSSFASATAMGADAHAVRAKSLSIDDKRMSAILRTRTTIPPESYARFDLTLEASEAIDFGVAQEIRDFKIPSGNKVWDLMHRG